MSRLRIMYILPKSSMRIVLVSNAVRPIPITAIETEPIKPIEKFLEIRPKSDRFSSFDILFRSSVAIDLNNLDFYITSQNCFHLFIFLLGLLLSYNLSPNKKY